MPPEPDAPLIFVAEDEAPILELVVTRVEQAGYRTAHARNGWEAWDGIRTLKPDAVLLDINMGGMDGFAVLRSLRAHARTRDIPVLMLTARGGLEDVSRAIDLGAQDYLTKPFDERVLLQRVARLVRRREPPPQPATDDIVLL